MLSKIASIALALLVPLVFAFVGWFIWSDAIEKRAEFLRKNGAKEEEGLLMDAEEIRSRETTFLVATLLWGVFSLLFLRLAPRACGILNLVAGLVFLVLAIYGIITGDPYQAQAGAGLFVPFIHWLGMALITLLIPPLSILYAVFLYGVILVIGLLICRVSRSKYRHFVKSEKKSEKGRVKEDEE
ncbi:hypothetical protein IJI17_03310 [Candidatus Saccharibacteria bacterium]|nr:hypothetical protein [Candidatus Saccharibacteria bacterium]